MPITPPAKLMLIYVDESDKWGKPAIPLYEAIIEFLFHNGIDGATATYGTMGFGANRRLHKRGLFGITDDRSVTISVIDNEAKLQAILPRLSAMVDGGLIFLLDGQVVHHGVSSENAQPE